jgi:integrase
MHPRTRHHKLLEYKRVNEWYENLRARSETTCETYLRNFGLWLEWIDESPESVIKLASEDYKSFKSKISDRIREMEKSGKLGSYISVTLKALMSYLKFRNVSVKLNLNIRGENENPTIENQVPPSKDDLKKVLRRASTRTRVAISLMAFTGIRPRVMGDINGNDGLILRDIPELTLEPQITFNDMERPSILNVRASLSKNRKKYLTFLGREVKEYIVEYLNERKNGGEDLTPDCPLIQIQEKGWRKHRDYVDEPNKFLMTALILRDIKQTILDCGFEWRPYIFKNYYSAQMDMAENKGVISHSLRQFLIGHNGTINDSYARKTLTNEQIEEYREIFRRCEPFIETDVKGLPDEFIRQTREPLILAMSKLMQLELTEDQKNEILAFNQDEFQQWINDISEKEQPEGKKASGPKHVEVNADKLTSFLDQGYELISFYPKGDKAILRLP